MFDEKVRSYRQCIGGSEEVLIPVVKGKAKKAKLVAPGRKSVCSEEVEIIKVGLGCRKGRKTKEDTQ